MGSLGQATLLAVAIVCSCFLQTQAQGDTIPITLIPPNPIQGESITLRPEGVPENLFSCSWFRAATTDSSQRIVTYYPSNPNASLKGPAYTWRETVNPDCSLLISNLSANYSGNYTTQWSGIGIEQTGTTSFSVSVPISDMNITASTNKSIENSITVLNCTSKGSGVSYYWLKDNKNLTVGGPILLSNNNQILTFNTTNRNDSGLYTCCGYNAVSNGNTSFKLDVLYGPDDTVISPSTEYYPLGDSLTLTCSAESNPAAQYTWFVNGTHEVGKGTQYLIPALSFQDSGNYTCRAFNTETNLTSTSSVVVQVQENVTNVVISGPHEVTEGAFVTLNCTSSGSEVSYSWWKGMQQSANHPLDSGNQLN
uniref:Ig-like domain-containing protein n=1 Tax=Salvator merianae TaxID=96440 RepID=A0A8D0BGG5_SALMN